MFLYLVWQRELESVSCSYQPSELEAPIYNCFTSFQIDLNSFSFHNSNQRLYAQAMFPFITLTKQSYESANIVSQVLVIMVQVIRIMIIVLLHDLTRLASLDTLYNMTFTHPFLILSDVLQVWPM